MAKKETVYVIIYDHSFKDIRGYVKVTMGMNANSIEGRRFLHNVALVAMEDLEAGKRLAFHSGRKARKTTEDNLHMVKYQWDYSYIKRLY